MTAASGKSFLVLRSLFTFGTLFSCSCSSFSGLSVRFQIVVCMNFGQERQGSTIILLSSEVGFVFIQSLSLLAVPFSNVYCFVH